MQLTFSSMINATSESLKARKVLIVSSAVGISCSADLSMKKVLYPQGPGLVQYTFKTKSFLPYGPMNFIIMKVNCIIWTDQHINIGTYPICTKAYLSHDLATWNAITPCNKIDIPLVVYRLSNITYLGAQWLSGRVLDSRLRGRGFEPHWRHCVVVLEQDTFILA